MQPSTDRTLCANHGATIDLVATISGEPDQSAGRRHVNPTTAIRILVVEDDAMIGALLAELLQETGHIVYPIATTETEAVAAAAQYRPDLMIVDMRLRVGSGIAAVTEICHSGFVPHLFISGDAAQARVLRPRALIMQKPFRAVDLERAIARALVSPPF